jgi:hypothetical protein
MRVYVHVHISVFRYQLCLCFYNILIGFYDSPEGVVLTCQSLPRVVACKDRQLWVEIVDWYDFDVS